jgi:hypothetical protein
MPSLEVFMIPLSSASAISSGLTWSKIPGSRDYELKLNGEAVGTLRRPGWFSTSFLAETQAGNWTFRRGGCLGGGAQILDSLSHPIATLQSAWASGGTLTFADGQTFQLKCNGWWRPVWSVIGDTGATLLQVHTREKTVEVQAGSPVADSRLTLLILFTWYRVLQAEDDAAVAVLVAAS